MKNPTLPKGMRDFGPQTMLQRTYMCDIIKKVFRKYGFLPMETPAMEKVSTLTGKYGEEGEQLIFRVLKSGDFLKGTTPAEREEAKTLRPLIADKGLRYDLTVPLARYVAQHHHELTFPFKRSQIQPVWRADRPQKGRFREFYQCDADIVGADSLFYESEMLAMTQDIFTKLGIHDYIIHLNHRLLFKALAQALDIPSQEQTLCTILDKLEKIGWEKVLSLLQDKGIPPKKAAQLKEIMHTPATDIENQLQALQKHLGAQEAGKKAIADLRTLLDYMKKGSHNIDKIAITPTLARGIGYYTGAIFEVTIPEYPALGSISAGGRYDDLLTVFSGNPLPSIGLSFGLERIYEVLKQKELFSETHFVTTQLLVIPMTTTQEKEAITCLSHIRKQGISAELYPAGAKLKKNLSYADKKNIPFVAIIGENEAPNSCMLKNMQTGKQIMCTFDAVVATMQKTANKHKH